MISGRQRSVGSQFAKIWQALGRFTGLDQATGVYSGAYWRGTVDMREFLRDWRRWSRAERIAAVVILSTGLLGLPVALALNVL